MHNLRDDLHSNEEHGVELESINQQHIVQRNVRNYTHKKTEVNDRGDLFVREDKVVSNLV